MFRIIEMFCMCGKLLHSSGVTAIQNARVREISEEKKKSFCHHRFNQVAWMVHIAAVEHREVVGEKL